MLFNGGIVFSTVEEVIEIEDLKCQMFWRENMIYIFRLHKLENMDEGLYLDITTYIRTIKAAIVCWILIGFS